LCTNYGDTNNGGGPQPIVVGRRHDKVDMIGHQAVRPDRDTMLAALLTQQIAIEFVAGIGKTRSRADFRAG